MPNWEAPTVVLENATENISIPASSSPSDLSSASSPEPQHIEPSSMFRALALSPPEPVQPRGQEELERRLPGFRRIVLPRERTLIEIIKEQNSVSSDGEVLRLRAVKLSVVAERVGLRRLSVLTPRLRRLQLDGSVLSSLRDLGTGLTHLKELHVARCGLTSLDGIFGMNRLRELYAPGNKIKDLEPLASLHRLHTLDLSNNLISESTRIWTLGVCYSLRRICLHGCPISSRRDYHRFIASALPTLHFLDTVPLNDAGLNELDELFGQISSSESDDDQQSTATTPHASATHGHSSGSDDDDMAVNPPLLEDPTTTTPAPQRARMISRPATAPVTSSVTSAYSTTQETTTHSRPQTAQGSHAHTSRTVFDHLEILNALVGEETRCTGSRLTSGRPLCGNIARALRPRSTPGRPGAGDGGGGIDTGRTINRAHPRGNCGCSNCGKNEVLDAEETAGTSSGMACSEIPLEPGPDDWIKYRLQTGIDVQINYDDWPDCGDSSDVLARLERIEKETKRREDKETRKTEETDNRVEDETTEATDDYQSKLLYDYFHY